MKYSELLAQYKNKISYNSLLKTSEWKNKRDEIVRRDKKCCTNCGKTQTISHLNYLITFQTNDKLINNTIIYENHSLRSIKEELGLKNINVLTSPFIENRYCAISDNGTLFLVNWENIKEVPPPELAIYNGLTQLGKSYLIIAKKDEKFVNETFSVPILSENTIILHVHHKFYIENKLPWEYENDSLITLCNWCHWDLHEKTNVPIYTMINGQLHDLLYIPCKRCNGAGVIPKYKHVVNGLCFRCNGRLYEEIIATMI